MCSLYMFCNIRFACEQLPTEFTWKSWNAVCPYMFVVMAFYFEHFAAYGTSER